MSLWQWFLPLGGALVAAAFHLTNQRSYGKARGAFVIAAVAFAVPAWSLTPYPRAVAFALLIFSLLMMLRFVSEKEHPIVATLLVGPEHVSAQPGASGFALTVQVRNGPDEMGFHEDWKIEIASGDSSQSTVIRPAPGVAQVNGELAQLASHTLRPHQRATGMIAIEFQSPFQSSDALKNARFTVSVSPTRGRILPATFVAPANITRH